MLNQVNANQKIKNMIEHLKKMKALKLSLQGPVQPQVPSTGNVKRNTPS